MPCRVGITTRPNERRLEWEREVVGLSDWKILETYFSKQAAQDHEDRVAASHGCHASHGGADVGGLWYVYHFCYVRIR